MTINNITLDNLDSGVVQVITEIAEDVGIVFHENITLELRIDNTECSIVNMEQALKTVCQSVESKLKVGFAGELTRRADCLRKGVGGVLEVDAPLYLRTVFADILDNIAEDYREQRAISLACASDGVYLAQTDAMESDSDGNFYPVTKTMVVRIAKDKGKRTIGTFDKTFSQDVFLKKYPSLRIVSAIL